MPGTHLALSAVASGVLSHEVKQLGHEGDHSSWYSAKVEYGSYTLQFYPSSCYRVPHSSKCHNILNFLCCIYIIMIILLHIQIWKIIIREIIHYCQKWKNRRFYSVNATINKILQKFFQHCRPRLILPLFVHTSHCLVFISWQQIFL